MHWGAVNAPLEPEKFDALYARVDGTSAGARLLRTGLLLRRRSRLSPPVRIVNEYAWHNLFVRQLFIRPTAQEDCEITGPSSP